MAHHCLHCAIRDVIVEHAEEHRERDASGNTAVHSGEALSMLAEAVADFVTMPDVPLVRGAAFKHFMEALSDALGRRGLPADLKISATPDEPRAGGLH